MYCTLCSHRTPFLILACELCREGINQSRGLKQISLSNEKQSVQVLSLARYEDDVSRLILSAKAGKNLRTLRGLVRWLDEHRPELQAWCLGAKYIVAAPSSLWGRLRGKPDLAMALARNLSLITEIPIKTAPWHLFWRRTKRAKLSRAQRPSSASNLVYTLWAPNSEHNPKLVLVDDIVTTGSTLLELAAAFSAFQFTAVTLADASRKG